MPPTDCSDNSPFGWSTSHGTWTELGIARRYDNQAIYELGTKMATVVETASRVGLTPT